MYKRLTFLLLVIAPVFNTLALGESITFTFANRAITGTTPKYLEFDVMGQAGTAGTTRLGDTQVYINYSTAGFGSSIAGNGKITVTKGTLTSGELVPGSPLYTIINVADNATSRVSITIGYNYSSSPTSANFLPTSATQLIHVKIEITDQGQNAGLSFEESSMSGQQYQSDNSTKYNPVTATDVDNNPLPIQMASFTASVVRDNDVEVAWKTVSETNNYGFEVYRKRNENGEWKKLGFVEGHGTTLAAQSYTYVDKSVGFGKYFYQIKQIDLDGKSSAYGGPEMNVVVGVAPGQFVLAQNYPNPFNPTTTIEFALPKETHVSLEVYNVIGQRVATLVDETRPAGIYVVPFSANGGSASGGDASALASGTYFYRLSTGEVSLIKRMMILK